MPKVSIDFGNGKKMQRTLMGNTVLYICYPDGQVVDALPGVYRPEDFTPLAEAALTFMRSPAMTAATGAARTKLLADWHRTRFAASVQGERRRMTFSKAAVETPLLNAMGVLAKPEASSVPVAANVAPNVPPRQPSGFGGAPRTPGGGFGTGNPGTVLPAREEGAVAVLPPLPKLNYEKDLKSAFQQLSVNIEDISKGTYTVQRLKFQGVFGPTTPRMSPEDLGKLVVAMDSKNNVTVVHPTADLLLATCDTPQTPQSLRDVLFKQVLHVPIDDPYLGLADALVPGSPTVP
ncbi:MAG TPA: hypothetical protein VKU00_12120 [Chthonomonadaceae bacterium]|nr:hypothetical protein [Chthonomonadaceae bacterium]